MRGCVVEQRFECGVRPAAGPFRAVRTDGGIVSFRRFPGPAVRSLKYCSIIIYHRLFVNSTPFCEYFTSFLVSSQKKDTAEVTGLTIPLRMDAFFRGPRIRRTCVCRAVCHFRRAVCLFRRASGILTAIPFPLTERACREFFCLPLKRFPPPECIKF